MRETIKELLEGRYNQMKSHPSSVFKTVSLSIALIISACSCTCTPEKPSPPSTVMFLQGDARYRPIGQEAWKSIYVGTLIEPGALIQTPQSTLPTMYVYLGEKAVPPKKTFNGGVYDPALRPSNLLCLRGDSVIRIQDITNELSPDNKILRQRICLALYVGTIQANVKSNSIFLVGITNGVFIMQPGIFRMDAAGNIAIFEGQGELRLPDRGLTNLITANQRFDVQTGVIAGFDTMDNPNWRHDIWWASDPIYFNWAKPETITPVDRERIYKTPLHRPF